MAQSDDTQACQEPRSDGGERKIACSEQELLHCQFAEWYPLFSEQSANSSRPRLTPRSVVLLLDEEVVRYLTQDGVVLPEGFELSCAATKGAANDDNDDGWSSDSAAVDVASNDEDASDDDDGGGEGAAVSFPEAAPSGPAFAALAADMGRAIEALGGRVFPKLNWSCPKDAAWVNGGSLSCHTAGDVLCLLKSSLFATHDLLHAFDACRDATLTRPARFTLVLRRWCELHPSQLFRCFVRRRALVAVSQRDPSARYGHLEDDLPELSQLLQDFFEREVRNRFPDPDFVMDVYVDRQKRVWILDFNVFASVTDSLLFSWDELTADDSGSGIAHGSAGIANGSGGSSSGGTVCSALTPGAVGGGGGVLCSADVFAEECLTAGSEADSVDSAFVLGPDFRVVTAHMPLGSTDPMGRYRGPADAELLSQRAEGGRGGGGGGGEGNALGADFAALVERYGGLGL